VVDEKTKVRATKNGRKPLATISQNIPLWVLPRRPKNTVGTK
jgi:hypothetical protein